MAVERQHSNRFFLWRFKVCPIVFLSQSVPLCLCNFVCLCFCVFLPVFPCQSASRLTFENMDVWILKVRNMNKTCFRTCLHHTNPFLCQCSCGQVLSVDWGQARACPWEQEIESLRGNRTEELRVGGDNILSGSLGFDQSVEKYLLSLMDFSAPQAEYIVRTKR